jgi:hypothetical protein
MICLSSGILKMNKMGMKEDDKYDNAGGMGYDKASA